jgi:hypothetical protein
VPPLVDSLHFLNSHEIAILPSGRAELGTILVGVERLFALNNESYLGYRPPKRTRSGDALDLLRALQRQRIYSPRGVTVAGESHRQDFEARGRSQISTRELSRARANLASIPVGLRTPAAV